MSAEASADPSAAPDIVVYITSWCGSCRTARRWLDNAGVPYRPIDIDTDDDAAQVVMDLNRGNRSVPTILVNGRHVLTEPSAAELAAVFQHESPPKRP
ncbi:MAG: mycoredoxin [Chloroflexi bacterium]|nr:MAG: mycoredoxin [Chloroflexota bacterium]